MQHRYNKVIGAALMVAMFGAPLAAHAERIIRCESYGMKYRYCPADTDNRVELDRKLSLFECRRRWRTTRASKLNKRWQPGLLAITRAMTNLSV